MMKPIAWAVFLLLSLGFFHLGAAAPAAADNGKAAFPKPLEEYHDEAIPGVFGKLVHRMQADPFNPVGTLIFFAAIIHTFLAPGSCRWRTAWNINSTRWRLKKGRQRTSVPYA